MTWRVVTITQCAKLDLRLNHMVIRRQQDTQRVNLSELEAVVIESTMVSMTAALLVALTRKKIRVIFCDEKHNPQSELQPYFACHDCSRKVAQQMEWDEQLKGELWQQIVREKIKNQRLHLCKRTAPQEAIDLLAKYESEVEPADASHREGIAAKVYFPALFGADFSRDHNCPINAGLNYGYQMVLSIFNRELKANGYLTELGIFHNSQHNPFNFSSDLMEPFRPLVDTWVYDCGLTQFATEEKRKMQNMLDISLMIHHRQQLLHHAIRIYVNSIARALNSGDLHEVRFFSYEL